MAAPLQTGNTLAKDRQKELMELFRFDTLLDMSELEYKKKILPLLTGVDLPYKLFRRNVQLAYRYKHKTFR